MWGVPEAVTWAWVGARGEMVGCTIGRWSVAWVALAVSRFVQAEHRQHIYCTHTTEPSNRAAHCMLRVRPPVERRVGSSSRGRLPKILIARLGSQREPIQAMLALPKISARGHAVRFMDVPDLRGLRSMC